MVPEIFGKRSQRQWNVGGERNAPQSSKESAALERAQKGSSLSTAQKARKSLLPKGPETPRAGRPNTWLWSEKLPHRRACFFGFPFVPSSPPMESGTGQHFLRGNQFFMMHRSCQAACFKNRGSPIWKNITLPIPFSIQKTRLGGGGYPTES